MSQRDFYQISLKIILKNSKNEVLILGGHPAGSYAGFYDLPGGRIDVEEFITPFTDIIKREVAEEIGDIQISLNPKPVAIGRHLIPASMSSEKKDLHLMYIFFEARLIGGEITISDEHSDFQWVLLEEIDPSKYFKSGILEGVNMYLKN